MEARNYRSILSVAFSRALFFVFLLWVAAGANYRGPTTPNFIIETADPNFAQQVAQVAEKWRHDLAVEWVGEALPNWAQPCVMTVQAGPNLGAGGATSFVFDRGEVYGWRMSIQGSQERILDSVLPHEITHMIYASHFREPLPRWADEGGATSVEHASEKNKHRQMLHEYLQTNRGIPFTKMFAMTEYPQDIMPLYAQGYSLAELLIQTGGRRKYVEFLGDGLKSENWASAVERHYGIKDLGGLQNAWLAWVRQGSPNIAPRNNTPTAAPNAMQVASSQPTAAQPVAPETNQGYAQPNNPIASVAVSMSNQATPMAQPTPAPPTPMYASNTSQATTSNVVVASNVMAEVPANADARLVPVRMPGAVALASQVASSSPTASSAQPTPNPSNQASVAVPPAQPIATVTLQPPQILPATGWRGAGKSSPVNAASYAEASPPASAGNASPDASAMAGTPMPPISAPVSSTTAPTADPFRTTEVSHPLAIEQPRQTVIR
jgi:hypothetical protein